MTKNDNKKRVRENKQSELVVKEEKNAQKRLFPSKLFDTLQFQERDNQKFKIKSLFSVCYIENNPAKNVITNKLKLFSCSTSGNENFLKALEKLLLQIFYKKALYTVCTTHIYT